MTDEIPANEPRRAIGRTASSGTAEAAARPRRTDGQRFHGVWQLAWPSITTFALQSVVGLVDLVFVSRLGSDEVAGVGIGYQLQFASLSLIAAVATGTVALVARATGGGDQRQAERVLRASLFLAVGLGVVLSCLAPFARHFVALFGLDPPVVAIGGSYLRILLFGGVPLALGITFASALRGAGDVRVPLLIGVAMNGVNVVGDYALIFGHFGAPALGADGSALASVIAYSLAAALYFALWRGNRLAIRRSSEPEIERGAAHGRVDIELCRRVGRIGLPTCLEQLAFNAGLFLFVAVFSHFGTDAVSGYFIGVRVINFALIPGMGFQIAAATLVGQHLGAKQPEQAARSGWRATAGAALAMSTLGVAIAVFVETVVGWFGPVGTETSRLAIAFLLIVCAAQPLMALEFGIGGSLRGAGDTRFPLIATLMGLFVCRLGGALIVIHAFGGTVTTAWLCVFVDYAVKGALLADRFRRGRWKTVRV